MGRIRSAAIGADYPGIAAWIGVALALAAGAALLLAWPADIEYKDDERWIFEHARAVLGGASWPSIGMATSIGFPNAGMSLWPFVVLAYLGGASTPPELARAVQVSTIVALFGLALFVRCAIARRDRECWLWALTLWAVNPVAIILERKIWLPSILPLPAVAFIAAWWYRRRAAAAFIWGLLGVVMAQIHLAVWIFVAALAAWTFIYDRKTVAWKGWFAGSAIGSLTAVPWLLESAGRIGTAVGSHWRVPNATFYLRWVTQPFGIGVEYSLGRAHMIKYLMGPRLVGEPTYFMGFIHALLAFLLAVVVVRAIRRAVQSPSLSARALFLGNEPATVLINAALWGYGLILTLLTIGPLDANRHYLIVVMPLMALWATRLVLYGDQSSERRYARAILGALCLAEAIASVGVLDYVHDTQIICWEYGQTWGSQQSAPRACP